MGRIEMNDWASYTVQLQPLARKLEDHLTRREFKEADAVSDLLADLAFDIKRAIINHELRNL
jgi:hypothetical protein